MNRSPSRHFSWKNWKNNSKSASSCNSSITSAYYPSVGSYLGRIRNFTAATFANWKDRLTWRFLISYACFWWKLYISDLSITLYCPQFCCFWLLFCYPCVLRLIWRFLIRFWTCAWTQGAAPFDEVYRSLSNYEGKLHHICKLTSCSSSFDMVFDLCQARSTWQWCCTISWSSSPALAVLVLHSSHRPGCGVCFFNKGFQAFCNRIGNSECIAHYIALVSQHPRSPPSPICWSTSPDSLAPCSYLSVSSANSGS